MRLSVREIFMNDIYLDMMLLKTSLSSDLEIYYKIISKIRCWSGLSKDPLNNIIICRYL